VFGWHKRTQQTHGDLQSIAIAASLLVSLLLPFYIDVRQLLQMEYSAYLREDSSKWHCPAAMTTMCATINYRVFLFLCFINILTHTPRSVFLSCGDIPALLFVVSLMTFTGSVCVSVVFLKHSCAYCHCNSTVSTLNTRLQIQFSSQTSEWVETLLSEAWAAASYFTLRKALDCLKLLIQSWLNLKRQIFFCQAYCFPEFVPVLAAKCSAMFTWSSSLL